MAISANNYSLQGRCSPAIGTSYDSCGTVTRCHVITATPSELESIFMDGANFRDMTSLLLAQFEMKACGTRVNGLFDFLMASSRQFGSLVSKKNVKGGEPFIEPFILARQKSIINDEYWTVLNGSGTAGAYTIHVINRYGIELDPNWFAVGLRVFIFSKTGGGTATRTAWRVTAAALSSYSGTSTIEVSLVSENAGTLGNGSKVLFPTTGFLVLGTNNVNDFERYCQQYAMLFQREWLNAFWWNKPISANQTLSHYKNLDKIYTYGGSDLYLPNETKCVGFRANAIGVYEQLLQCGAVYDLQGQQLNLLELFDKIYDIHRSRSNQGKVADSIDIYTDTTTAFLFHRAMIRYYNTQYEGLARFNISVSEGEHGVLGFRWSSYYLLFPKGVTINVITHFFFDDFGSAAEAESMVATGRFLWILDLGGGIYPGIIASNRKVWRSGEISDLAKIDSDYACVMENPTQEVSLNSLTWTAVVECPPDNLVIENFADVVPDHSDKSQTPSYDDLYTYVG